MRRRSFSACTEFTYPTGFAQHIAVVYDLSPEAQRELLAKAIVGYDMYHADGPGEDELKFRGLGV